MPIKFKCESCSVVLTVKEELAGKKGRCPKCQKPITVPEAGADQSEGAGTPPPAAAAASPTRTPPPRPAPGTGGQKPAPKIMVQTIGPVMVATIMEPRLTEIADIRDVGEALMALLERAEKPLVVLDFSKVTYLPSAMIGKLTAMHKKAESYKGSLVFCAIDPGVMQIFKITRLDKVFNIVPDLNTAMNSLKSRVARA